MRRGQIFYDSRITPAGKKYSVITPMGRLIHFGATGYQQYKDSTGLGRYSHLNHLDKCRRDRYKARHASDDYNNPEKSSYWSWHYLW